MQSIYEQTQKIFKLSGLVESRGKIFYENFTSPFAAQITHYFLENVYNTIKKNAIYRIDHFTGFITIYSIDENRNYIFGPFLSSTVSNVLQTNYFEKFHIKYRDREAFISFFEELPSFSQEDRFQTFLYLYSLVNSREIDVDKIDIINLNEKNARASISMISKAETMFSYRSLDRDSLNKTENIYHFQQQVCHYIREGNPQQLLKLWKTEKMEIHTGLCDEIITNYRNIAISGVSFGAQAAIEGGLSVEVAFHILDIFFVLIHEKNDVDEILSLISTCMLDFARRVERIKLPQEMPPVIGSAIAYINAHIFEHITAAQVALALNINATYLSKQFSKHMNCSITRYIHECKVKEAKNLLRTSNRSLASISTELCFSSQAHFQRVFKQYEGITPMQYRNSLS